MQVVMGVGKFNRIDVRNAMSLEEQQQAQQAQQEAAGAAVGAVVAVAS